MPDKRVTPEQARMVHAADTLTGMARASAPAAVAFLREAVAQGASPEDARYLAGVFLRHLLGGVDAKGDG